LLEYGTGGNGASRLLVTNERAGRVKRVSIIGNSRKDGKGKKKPEGDETVIPIAKESITDIKATAGGREGLEGEEHHRWRSVDSGGRAEGQNGGRDVFKKARAAQLSVQKREINRRP